MKKVAIVPYIRKTGVREVLDRAVVWLEDHGIGITLPHVEAEESGLTRYAASDDSLFDGVDIVVALGGDGTTLRALRLMRETPLPVLGVNLGEMGFLMWVGPDQLEAALDRVNSGEFRIEERHMLEARINLADGGSIKRLALNDILIGREEFSRLIKLDISISGTPFCTYAADGVLVTTPTGSTAYAFSAGGPVISPAADVFAMVPICPHSLNNRSLVFGSRERLSIKPVPTEMLGRTGVSIDGVAIQEIGKVSSVDIRLAERKFKFVGLNGPDFYQSLGLKLKGWLGL